MAFSDGYRPATDTSSFTNGGIPLTYGEAASFALSPFSGIMNEQALLVMRQPSYQGAVWEQDFEQQILAEYLFDMSQKNSDEDEGIASIRRTFYSLVRWARHEYVTRCQNQANNRLQPRDVDHRSVVSEQTSPAELVDLNNQKPIVLGLQDIERGEPGDLGPQAVQVIRRQLRVVGFDTNSPTYNSDPTAEELLAGHHVEKEPQGEPYMPILARASALVVATGARLYLNNDIPEVSRRIVKA